MAVVVLLVFETTYFGKSLRKFCLKPLSSRRPGVRGQSPFLFEGEMHGVHHDKVATILNKNRRDDAENRQLFKGGKGGFETDDEKPRKKKESRGCSYWWRKKTPRIT